LMQMQHGFFLPDNAVGVTVLEHWFIGLLYTIIGRYVGQSSALKSVGCLHRCVLTSGVYSEG